jgi:UDP-N-acetylmuramoylalanine--D-glutamate ligase
MRFSALDGLTIGVWGAGVETRSFARHVAEKLPRARIAVVVLEQETEAPELTAGATVVDADGAVAALERCDVLVRSPGVSIYRPELRALRIPIATPTGLWMAERGGRNVIGVTATKGKSTTAKLIAHLVAKTGRRVHLGGNIGLPALDFLDADVGELAVVELSSYQIADLPAGPEVAMASNVYPEHLQWHVTIDAYRADKLKLLALPGVRRCVVNATSPEVMAAPKATDDVWRFGVPPGWHVTDDGAVARDAEPVLAPDQIPLIGKHNALNVCGALTALEALEIPLPPLPAAIADFEGLPHRLQVVHRAEGVTWVDDSISTEPHAAKFAIESFPGQPVVLIGGGFDRGQDYGFLGALLAQRGAHVLGLPKTGERLIEAALAAGVPRERATNVKDLPAAVAAARAAAGPGTVVLLSPAAPSFTTHRNFEVRGDDFRDLVRNG